MVHRENKDVGVVKQTRGFWSKKVVNLIIWVSEHRKKGAPVEPEIDLEGNDMWLVEGGSAGTGGSVVAMVEMGVVMDNMRPDLVYGSHKHRHTFGASKTTSRKHNQRIVCWSNTTACSSEKQAAHEGDHYMGFHRRLGHLLRVH